MASLILKVHLQEHEMLSHCLQNMFFKLEFILSWRLSLKSLAKTNQRIWNLTYPKVRFEGGACVMTEVGDGMVGCRASKPKCSGREPGRTIVGVGAEFLGGVSYKIKTKNKIN